MLDRITLDAARDLLREGVSISEAAHRLGFSERSAFSRACKRWTGYRTILRSRDDSEALSAAVK